MCNECKNNNVIYIIIVWPTKFKVKILNFKYLVNHIKYILNKKNKWEWINESFTNISEWEWVIDNISEWEWINASLMRVSSKQGEMQALQQFEISHYT